MSSINKLQFDNLVTQLVEQGGSDLHFSAGNFPMARIKGNLLPLANEVLTGLNVEEFILPLLNEEQKKRLADNKSLIFGYTFNNNLRFKINLFQQKDSLAADLHFIDGRIRGLKELGLPDVVSQLTGLNSGLLIIAGTFKSGKNTTAAAMIEQINAGREAKILTLEEPIERLFTGNRAIIQQREIGRDTPSMIDGLKDATEANEDVLFVAEVKSREEINVVLELAEQGRLVIVLTSADSCLDVLVKFFSYFSTDERSRFTDLFSRTLRAIICQKLLKSQNGDLVLASEVLINNNAVRLAIEGERLNQIDNILRTSVVEGMRTMEASLAELVKSGKLDINEALKNANDKEMLKRMITGEY